MIHRPLAAEITRARRHGIADLLARSAARHPGKTAIITGEVRQTYAELDDHVRRTAGALADRGIAQGDRVVILSRNSHGFVVAYFALARLGAISVPVNFMFTPREVGHILEHCDAAGVIAGEDLVATADEALRRSGPIAPLRVVIGENEHPGWVRLDDLAAGGRPDTPGADLHDDDPVQIMYTSGTESRPKGAMMTTRNLIAGYLTTIVEGGMTHDDVEIHALPFYHCAQLHNFLTTNVYLGGTSIVLPGPEPGRVLETIECERVTKFFAPPTVWISLLRHPAFAARDLTSLRKGYYGAAAMPVEVLSELRERLPGLRLYNFYGQTEMSPLATVLAPQDQERKAGSAGRPGLNVETRVVDAHDNPLPAGRIGEIVHRGPHTMLGYWNDPERTAESFRGGWFHSGDLGRFDEDGYLYVVDRKKDMVNTGGENVSGREVEEVLYTHPAVAEAAVFGVPHPYWVEAVTAAVVLRPGAAATAEDLIRHCATTLAGYKVPKFVVPVRSLPKNPSGKILKRDLRERHANLAE